MKKLMSIWILVTTAVSGCALDPNGGGGAFNTNAAKVHIYSAEEQANMSSAGTIETMITPSEMRERLTNPGKYTKPTGEVSYCDAGLAALMTCPHSPYQSKFQKPGVCKIT